MVQQHSPELQEYISKLTNPQLILRGWLVMVILEFGALLLGIAFFIIVQGIVLGVAWLAPFWKPAFIAYTKALGIKDIEFIRLPVQWWRVLMLVIKTSVVLLLFFVGVKFLLTKGFLGQNLIYVICSR